MSLLTILPEPTSFIAGAVSGICGVALCQPLDLIKVRVQNSGGNDFKVLKNVIKQEGAQTLWRGLELSIFGSILGNAISFGIVENLKKQVMRNRPDQMTGWEHAFCGLCSGFSTSLLCTPLEMIKIRLQTQQAGTKEYKGTVQSIRELHRKMGFRGLYKGFWMTCTRDMIGDATYFGVYQSAPRFYYGDMENVEKRSYLDIMIAGGIGGVAAWTSIYPLDTVKSRIQADSLTAPKYKGFVDCLTKTVKQEGVRQLFKGYYTCILRTFPVNMVMIICFEFTMNILGR